MINEDKLEIIRDRFGGIDEEEEEARDQIARELSSCTMKKTIIQSISFIELSILITMIHHLFYIYTTLHTLQYILDDYAIYLFYIRTLISWL